MRPSRLPFLPCLLSLCLLAAAPLAAAPPAAAPFWFVQVTDTHLGLADGQGELVDKIVKRINALPVPVAFVVHTGDLTSEKTLFKDDLAKAVARFAPLKCPVHFVAGNHDIDPHIHGERCRTAWTNAVRPLAYRVEHAGVRLLFVHVSPLAWNSRLAGYDPLAWLQGELAAAGDRPVIVFQHEPWAVDFYANRMHPNRWLGNAGKWDAALASAKRLVGVLCGHFHRDEVHWVGSAPVFVASSIARYWGRQPSFRLYRFEDGRLAYRTVYVE